MNSIKKINSFYKQLKTKAPKLYIFLKDNKCLKKFGKNCNWEYRDKTIMGSFTWRHSKEGHDYWQNRHYEYNIFLKKILNEL